MANEMFSINSPTLKSALSDFPIEFPRYQRNKAWDEEGRFNLCISVFKRYPIGSIVVKEIGEDGSVDKRWILDGRQRYETLNDMQNPESIYMWAKKCCSLLEDKMTSEDVKASVYDYISNYLGYEVNDDTDAGLKELVWIICNVHPIKKKGSSGICVDDILKDPSF